MDAELEALAEEIRLAHRPEVLFGADDFVLPPEMLLEALGKQYSKFKRTIDPKGYSFPDDLETAAEADEKLERFYKEAQERIQLGLFGMPGYDRLKPAYLTRSFMVGGNTYYVGAKLRESKRSSLYSGFMERAGHSIGEVVLKLANSISMNRWIENEARILGLLHEQGAPQWKHLPLIIDRFESSNRAGLVLRSFSGHTLSEVRCHRNWVDGVDRKHMIWMLDRILSLLGYVHRCGIVHGGLNPELLSIQGRSHNVIVSGWGGAVHNPAITKEKVMADESPFMAPEVRAGGEIGPWTDLYSLGKCMIWLLGGDLAGNTMPDNVEEPIQRFLLRLVRPDPEKRPSDAWELYREETEIKDSLWPRRYVPFDMT